MQKRELSKNVLLLVTLIFLVFACKELDLNDPLESKPEMPSIASMQLDFSTFPENNNLPKFTGNYENYGIETHDNWVEHGCMVFLGKH